MFCKGKSWGQVEEAKDKVSSLVLTDIRRIKECDWVGRDQLITL